MYGNVIFVKGDFLEKNKKTLAEFVRGLKEAWTFAIKNSNKVYSILLANMKEMDKASGKDVMLKTFDFVAFDVGNDRIGFIEKKKWEDTVDIIVKFNKKIKGAKVDKEKAYNGYENLIK
jgi:ABC-type nitrate/sulfonate/bicarbonate transport system substrate-binding protein